MRLLTKMSATGLGHDMNSIKKIFAAENAPARFFVGRIFGIAKGTKDYVDKNSGEMRFGLTGDFGGISSLDSIEDAKSKVCYLPEVAQQDVIDKMGGIGEDGKPSAKQSVEFAYDIYAVKRESAATGYVFDVDMLITVQENDPLANMFAKIEKGLPNKVSAESLLAAPVSDVAAEAEKGNVIDAEPETKKTK